MEGLTGARAEFVPDKNYTSADDGRHELVRSASAHLVAVRSVKVEASVFDHQLCSNPENPKVSNRELQK
jgi:hypothetical protein